MRIAILALLFTLILTVPTRAEEAAPSLPFHLPTPAGWLTETIPFPLGFAPDLDYQGFEELRFAPGWRQAESEQMWAYTFVWWIPEETPLSEERLEKDLSAYYGGLMVAVAQGKDFDLGDAKFVVELAPPLASDDQETYLLGTAETFDSFVTAEMISLNVKICQVSCEEQGRTALFFEISPQPLEHGIWAEMDAIRQGFRCTP